MGKYDLTQDMGGYWDFNELIPATPEEIKKLFDYEAGMLKDTYDQLNLIDWGAKDINVSEQFKRNLLLESFAIHMRVLIDFFYYTKRKIKKGTMAEPLKYINDLIVSDLSSDSKKLDIAKNKLLENAKNKADKQLAHLSRWRIKLEKDGLKGWECYKNIYEELERLVRKAN